MLLSRLCWLPLLAGLLPPAPAQKFSALTVSPGRVPASPWPGLWAQRAGDPRGGGASSSWRAEAGGTLAGGRHEPPGWTAAGCGGRTGCWRRGWAGVGARSRVHRRRRPRREHRRTHQRVGTHSPLTQLPGARLCTGSLRGRSLGEGAARKFRLSLLETSLREGGKSRWHYK